MQLEAGMEYLRDPPGGQGQAELRGALGGQDRATLEILPLRGALGGHDRASLEMHVEAQIV
jgi:hypothetical protein